MLPNKMLNITLCKFSYVLEYALGQRVHQESLYRCTMSLQRISVEENQPKIIRPRFNGKKQEERKNTINQDMQV